MNEIYDINNMILILPGHPEKPISKAEVELAMETLHKYGVIDGDTLRAIKGKAPVWKPEDEMRRRAKTWDDFVATQCARVVSGKSPFAVAEFHLTSCFSKTEFLENPVAYTEERMDALIEWATNKKDEIMGFVERTMKAYGPEDEK